MSEKKYYIHKEDDKTEIVYFDYNKLMGFDFSPKNKIKYDGIVVNKMVIIKPSMIEKILRKKIKNKLDLYLKLIVRFIESDDSTDGSSLREALNDLSRYNNIVMYKYRKYLDDKYFKLLLKKIAILEYELKSKLATINELDFESEYDLVEEKATNRRR